MTCYALRHDGIKLSVGLTDGVTHDEAIKILEREVTGLPTPLVGGKPQGFSVEVFEYESSAAFNSGAAGKKLGAIGKAPNGAAHFTAVKPAPVAEERFMLRKPNGKETGSHSIDELLAQVQTDDALPAGSQCGVYIGHDQIGYIVKEADGSATGRLGRSPVV